MTVLSRRSYIGIAKETTQGTYVAPTFFIPVTTPVGEDIYVPIRDESLRGNDTVLQGLYQGPGDSAVSFDVMAYPDAVGYILRSIIGPDTVTAGTSTTLASNCVAGATTLSLTASVPANSTIQISDTGGANLEWVGVTTVTGTGPYTATVASPSSGTKYAHTAAGGAVVSQSSHAFAQSPTTAQVSYSITKYDVATNSGATSTRGFAGCKLSEVAVKIDPKGAVTLSPKWIGWLSQTEPNPASPVFTTLQPILGWQWALTDGGSASTRGLTYDVTYKRTGTEAIHASTGTQNPREVFQGGFEADGTLKTIFESDADLSLYLNYTQLPIVNALVQPAPSGGMGLTLTHSRAGMTKGTPDATGAYLTAAFDLSAIYNGTDAGAVTATLTNYSSTSY